MFILSVIMSSILFMSTEYVLKFGMKNGAVFQVNAGKISNIDFEESANKHPYPILEDATEIPNNYFRGALAPMPLPSTLTVIKDRGFYECLNNVIIVPDGVEKIGKAGLMRGSGNVEYIYLPKSVKKLGELSLKGKEYHDKAGFYGYISNPCVVFESESPQEGFLSALLNLVDYSSGPALIDDGMEPQIIYVPKAGMDNYVEARDSYFVSRNVPEFANIYIKIYSYKPVRIEIIGGGSDSDYIYSYQPTVENQGEITKVRWAVSDEDTASIDSDGVLKPLKPGKTHVHCIVSTPTSEGKDIEFYFFKPVEVTPDMIKPLK